MSQCLKPHDYQQVGAEFVLDRWMFQKEPGAGLFLDCGLGKTAITLLAWNVMKNFRGLNSTLLIAPPRVCHNVWSRESQKWNQFSDMSFSVIHGPTKDRAAAVRKTADIHLCPTTMVKWLVEYLTSMKMRDRWDTLIVDESSLFKSGSSVRFKKLKLLLPNLKRRLCLTGTPTPHSYIDLWSQCFILDDGARLGRNQGNFRDRFCKSAGFQGRQWKLRAGCEDQVNELIGDMVLSMRAEDHLDMPPLIYNDVFVQISGSARDMYVTFENELVAMLQGVHVPEGFDHELTAFDDGELSEGEMSANGAAAKYVKCLQIASGAAYRSDDFGTRLGTQFLHTEKLNAVEEIVNELNGKPVVIAYRHTCELQLLRTKWPKLPAIYSATTEEETTQLLDQWNEGKLPMLAVQPQSLSHGVNMQEGPGRDIIFFTLPDIYDTCWQLICRLWRQGVGSKVRVHRIITADTVDEKLLERTNAKGEGQESLLNALKEWSRNK